MRAGSWGGGGERGEKTGGDMGKGGGAVGMGCCSPPSFLPRVLGGGEEAAGCEFGGGGRRYPYPPPQPSVLSSLGSRVPAPGCGAVRVTPGSPGTTPPPPPGAARSGDESGKGVLLPEQRVLLSSQE